MDIEKVVGRGHAFSGLVDQPGKSMSSANHFLDVQRPVQSAETGPEQGRRPVYAAWPAARARFETPTPEPRTPQTQRAPPHSRSHTSQCPSHWKSAGISDSVRVSEHWIDARLNRSSHFTTSAFLSIASARNRSEERRVGKEC